MPFSNLPLSYCTNVHPGRNVAEVIHGLQEYTAPLSQNCGGGVAAGLWLAQPVIAEILATKAGLANLQETLLSHGLTCHSLNAFPYGDFHSERVKEQVYLPDWSNPRRREYTQNCAQVLAELLPENGEGSISTMPLGFKGFAYPLDFESIAIRELLQTANFLKDLETRTGKTVRLAIEPEPYCLLETTPETITFFRKLFATADTLQQGETARRYLGLCYDVCHQAVEFEPIAESISSLVQEGIRLNKIHITCAIRLERPGENQTGREALANYAEQRYLHQTIGKTSAGSALRSVDLSADFARQPPTEWQQAPEWRIHFHVPVNLNDLGPLGTTKAQLIEALQTVRDLDYTPHLEVETYTWEVLPGVETKRTPQDLVAGLTQEILGTRKLLSELST